MTNNDGGGGHWWGHEIIMGLGARRGNTKGKGGVVSYLPKGLWDYKFTTLSLISTNSMYVVSKNSSSLSRRPFLRTKQFCSSLHILSGGSNSDPLQINQRD